MKVTFAAGAERDLQEILNYIEEQAGPLVANAYVRRLYQYCLDFETFPLRGMARNHIRRGLRTIGYRRKATIAFIVRKDEVIIMRVFQKGRRVKLR